MESQNILEAIAFGAAANPEKLLLQKSFLFKNYFFYFTTELIKLLFHLVNFKKWQNCVRLK